MTLTDGRSTVSSPGPRIPASEVDFRVLFDGSVTLLWAISDDGVAWADEHLPEDRISWGGATVIEHRYVEDILNGIDSDGLVVGRAA